MQFESEHIFHIYNQGNNRQKIFFKKENYIFFLNKIQNHILPFTDILAWCLMPNHFHILAYVNHIELLLSTVGVTARMAGAQSSHPDSFPSRAQSFNDSIGIMLRTYTRAINNQENRTGALFREETKAICLTKITEITPGWNSSIGIMFVKGDSLQS
jgi:putative transposase